MKEYYDAIIIGSGVAGLTCALNLNENKQIAVLAKTILTECNSYLAQGGISCTRSPEDEPVYIQDTLVAGHYENDLDIVKLVIHDSPNLLQDLVNFGVNFDRRKDGRFHMTKEGGHTVSRIYHCGDYTGKAVVDTLLERVKEKPNVTLLENTVMVDILVADGVCNGVVVRNQDGYTGLYSNHVIFASGGIGGLFPVSTNFPHITGDGLAIALFHGIQTKNIEYIQIHPTLYYSKEPGRKFLISESVRGEGGILLNAAGERFTDELQPRDVVSAAIMDQMAKDHTNYVYLSMENIDKKDLLLHFPTIYQFCMEQGVDITKEPIKVTPGQHYHMGGIQVNQLGKTSLDELYAIGEVACSGFHGKNRLASNSLLEALYFGKIVAKFINGSHRKWRGQKMKVDPYRYRDIQRIYQERIKMEIKRKDQRFYEQWFNA